jgi:hypothetical protein
MVTLQEIILPRINISHPVGDVGKSFQHGAIVYDKREVIFRPAIIDAQTQHLKQPGSEPLTIVVIGKKDTVFVEKVSGGARGLTVKSEAAVVAAGGTTDWREWDQKGRTQKYFQPMLDLLVAIKRPSKTIEGQPYPADYSGDSVYGFEIDGEYYALAFWACKGSAYTDACKKGILQQQVTGCLRNKQTYEFSFTLTTRLAKRGTNDVWVPVVLPKTKTTPAMQLEARNILDPSAGYTAPADDTAAE